ncbi:nuclear transport factor 2 family protein [Chloroflexota bacterium]
MTNLKEGETAPMLELLDRSSIRDIIDRYFFALDRRDWDELSSCFTSDARWESSSDNVVITGNKAIVERLHFVAKFSASSHMPSSQSIKISGDTAAADTFALVHLVFGPIDNGRIFVRGLRYLDEFVRTAEGWRIQHRRHIPIWQYVAETVPTFTIEH